MDSSKNQHYISQAFSLVFKDYLYIVLALSLALNLLAIYYFIFLESTILKVFFESNTPFYNWFYIILTVLISIFFGAAVTLLIYQWREQKESSPTHAGNTLISTFLGAISMGCPVCGAFLLSVLGISTGLFAFPFQGLEIKAISLGLFSFAILASAKSISDKACGVCEPIKKETFLGIEKGDLLLNFKKETLKPFLPVLIGIGLLLLVAYLPALADKLNFRVSFQPNSQANILSGLSDRTDETELSDKPDQPNQSDSSDLLSQINPTDGYTINAVYGDIGPKLLAVGAIDFEQMKLLYEKSGQPLTSEQIKILKEGSQEKIKITPENSYFLLNFLWAFGLANKNRVLDEGPMMQYGGPDQIGYFASTGGWSLGTKDAVEFYSKSEIIKLTSQQQKILEEFAYNSYRPCCSNPTAFPDCNHGMAALALGEIMASQGAGVDEIFEAFKYFNAFWFPTTYFDVAQYFKAKEGKDWKDVSGRIVAGKDYSTPQGWDRVRNWLSSQKLLEEPPAGGGGCGV